jgi:hypothetical protein
LGKTQETEAPGMACPIPFQLLNSNVNLEQNLAKNGHIIVVLIDPNCLLHRQWHSGN